MIIFDWKSLFIGILSGIIILLSFYLHFQGEDYRIISKKSPLTVKEHVGTFPNGKNLDRYLIAYRGRIHYVYVTDDIVTINKKSVNGKTTNTETVVYYQAKK
jgi:hypothetical protein